MAFRRTFALVALGAGLALGAHAAEEANWSDDAAEKLPKLNAFQEKKEWDQAIVFIDDCIKASKPNSYDLVMFLQYKAKFFMMKNTLAEAIAPFERSLEIGLPAKFIKPDDVQWTRFYLAQIYYQESQVKGIAPDEQKAKALKALSYIDQWNAASTKANPDFTQFHAQVLFNLAQITGVGGNPNMEYLVNAEKVLRQALTQTVKAKDVLYLILVATLQQQNKYQEAAEYLEILVKMQPNNKNNWGQLFATYYQLSSQASDAKDLQKAFEYSVRAALTMDRAQKFGILNTQKDNFNRVGIYFNINQHEKATDLLDAGLRDGSIEDILKNWEILAFSYTQINKYDAAIRTLQEAIKRYPDKGGLHFSLAQNYYSIEKTKDAYASALKAIAVGNLEKPYPAHSFAAYMAFELRQFEEALKMIDLALAMPESKKDAQINKLRTAIVDSIKEREQNKKAVEQQHKNR